MNAFFLTLFVWKFSTIALDPFTVIKVPMSLLYFNGGEKGMWLAGGVAGIYLWYSIKKIQVPVAVYIELLAVAFLGGFGFYHFLQLFNDFPQWKTHLISAVTSTVLTGWIFKQKKAGVVSVLNQALLWFGIGQIFSAFFAVNRTILWWGMSGKQIAFLGLSLFSLWNAHMMDKKRNKGVT